MYRQRNQSIHVTGGMTVMSLFATPPALDKNGHELYMSHRVKPKVLRICNTRSHYNENYHRNSESGFKCSSHIKAKLHKKK